MPQKNAIILVITSFLGLLCAQGLIANVAHGDERRLSEVPAGTIIQLERAVMIRANDKESANISAPGNSANCRFSTEVISPLDRILMPGPLTVTLVSVASPFVTISLTANNRPAPSIVFVTLVETPQQVFKDSTYLDPNKFQYPKPVPF